MAGNDSYTVSLLHMNGVDASTTFTDNAAGGTHTWTARADAQIDTAQSYFDGASGLFDGTGDFIDTPTSTDFSFSTGDFTIDFWIKFSNVTPQQGVMGAYVDTNNIFQIWFFGNAGAGYNYRWQFYWKDGGTVRASNKHTNDQASPGTATWHHIAYVRYGANMKLYMDGVEQAITEATAPGTLTNINSVYQIAAAKTAAGAQTYTYASIDEVRISKGIARWTSTPFTPPTAAYSKVYEYSSTSGAVLGGTGPPARGRAHAPAAGALIGGAAHLLRTGVVIGQHGALVGGVSGINLGRSFTGDDGAIIGGVTPGIRGRSCTPDDGAIIGGAANLSRGVQLLGLGGAISGGISPRAHYQPILKSGEVRFDMGFPKISTRYVEEPVAGDPL